MKIITLDSKYWQVAAKHGLTREAVHRAVYDGMVKARRQLPPISDYVTIAISPDEPENTIPETGAGAITFTEEYISIVFDYNVPYGTKSLLAHLRSTVGHELVHAVSYYNVEGFKPAPLQAVVYEGLATVFEKSNGNTPLWVKYENDTTMNAWLDEIRHLPETEKNYDYLFSHPDGRRWIIYKTGTLMIEKLLAAGETLNDLMTLPYEEVLRKIER